MRRALATPTMAASNSGEVLNMAAVAKSTNVASSSLERSREGVQEVEEGAGVLRTRGIGLGHDDDGARARGSTRWQWRLGAPPWAWRERERGAEAGVRASAASGCSRVPLRPDRWARGRRTGATACPRGGHGLKPVGH
jgi:hypothetical protein